MLLTPFLLGRFRARAILSFSLIAYVLKHFIVFPAGSLAGVYGGSGMGNLGAVVATSEPSHGYPASAALVLPPLSAVYLEFDPDRP